MLATFAANQKVRSLYIHVPFCQSKCHYCDFYSVIITDRDLELWHQGVKKELKLIAHASKQGAYSSGKLKTIYYGGGTPSLVPPTLIGEQLELINSLFGIESDAEITLEANPGFSSMGSFRDLGINRLSFGLQTASKDLLKTLGRGTNVVAFVTDVLNAHKLGFSRISADIMIGLPGQSLSDVENTLDLLLDLPIGHISFYSLTLAKDTLFGERYSGEGYILLPSDELEREMYDLVLRKLTAGKVFPYEISNAARRGEESKHNLVYWQADSYLGIGPAAHSYLGGIRRGNPSSLRKLSNRVEHLFDTYQDTVSKTGSREEAYFPGTVEEIIDENSARQETVLLGLRLLAGVQYDNFEYRHGVRLYDAFSRQIDKLISKNLLVRDDESIRLSRTGLDFANEVFREFV